MTTPLLVVGGVWLSSLLNIALNTATNAPSYPKPLQMLQAHPWRAAAVLTVVLGLSTWWLWHRERSDTLLDGGAQAQQVTARGERVWKIPPPVRNFTGRRKQVVELRKRLARRRIVTLVPAGGVAALYGMGGIGKTQLARAYAHRYRRRYEVGWWVPAETEATIITAMRELASQLGLPARLPPGPLVQEIQRVLAVRSKWLLVFDNAEDSAQLEPFLPRTEQGHVLVTSRNPAWEGLADPVAVDVLSQEHAVKLLLTRSGDRGLDARTAAGELAEELGRLPLALEQAGAYAAQYRVSLSRYLVVFRERREELLAEGRPLAYHGTVDTTFALAAERLAQMNLAAMRLLEICALLAPDEIPVRLLLTEPTLLPQPLDQAARNSLSQDQVLGALFQAGLVTADAGDKVRVHRLVQTVTIHHMSESQRRARVAQVIELLRVLLSDQSREPESRARNVALSAHAQVALTHAAELQVSTTGVSRLLLLTGIGDLAHAHRELLAQVRRTWIEGVLDRSLGQVVRMDLGLTERPELVAHPWGSLLQMPGQPPQVLASGTISDLASRFDAQLLILGVPGAGKTTLLLELARDLLDRADSDPSAPAPVVLQLSSWTGDQPSLGSWVVDELLLRYGVPRRLAVGLLEQDRLALLLDGLDEVAANRRPACVEAINAFRNEHGGVPLVVCARTRDYHEVANMLSVRGAVEIQPLTQVQVRTWLQAGGERLAGLRNALRDPGHWLWDILDSPLMLSIVAMAYAGRAAPAISQDGGMEEVLDTYVGAMLTRQHAGVPIYSREDTERWLAWLAQRMGPESIFYPNLIQAGWLPKRLDRWLVTTGFGSILGLIGGLSVGLAAGWLLGLSVGPVIGLIMGLSIWLAVRFDIGRVSYLRRWLLYALLSRDGLVPVRLAHFLEYADNRILLRRAGSGYLFIHRVLQDHFAKKAGQRSWND